MILEGKKNKWNTSLKLVKETDKNVDLYSRCFFSLFDILDLRPNQLSSEKISKIKIFIESNQFLFDNLRHVIKTYSVNDFTMGCPYNKVT